MRRGAWPLDLYMVVYLLVVFLFFSASADSGIKNRHAFPLPSWPTTADGWLAVSPSTLSVMGSQVQRISYSRSVQSSPVIEINLCPFVFFQPLDSKQKSFAIQQSFLHMLELASDPYKRANLSSVHVLSSYQMASISSLLDDGFLQFLFHPTGISPCLSALRISSSPVLNLHGGGLNCCFRDWPSLQTTRPLLSLFRHSIQLIQEARLHRPEPVINQYTLLWFWCFSSMAIFRNFSLPSRTFFSADLLIDLGVLPHKVYSSMSAMNDLGDAVAATARLVGSRVTAGAHGNPSRSIGHVSKIRTTRVEGPTCDITFYVPSAICACIVLVESLYSTTGCVSVLYVA